jgi:hydroxyacyl-ACP dehydratase HTD2-like protein with hotdog domain
MSKDSDDWRGLELPVPIPELVVRPDHMQVFMFSAVTWNRHRIHYDKDAALADGHPDIVVQRGLIGDFLARLLTEWLGDSGEIRQLSWRVHQSAIPGQALHCSGDLVTIDFADGIGSAECELKMQDETGRDIASGRARLRLF